MPLIFTTSYLDDSLALFAHYKKLAESAIAQMTDEQLFIALGNEENSIAIIVKHLAGNMRSRWTNFLEADGEKPNRNRDDEFVQDFTSREQLLSVWEGGWSVLFETLRALSDQDLGRSITIRGEAHSVMQAINRQVAHNSYHVGQIVLLAKHLASDGWNTLTVPRNKSAEFNRRVAAGELSQR